MDTRSLHDPVEALYDSRVRGAVVVGTADGNRVHLHGGCWVSPCSTRPPRIMVAFPKEFEGAQIVERGGGFTVNLQAREDVAWMEAFFRGEQAIRDDRKGLFLRSETGCPVLAESVAYFDCRLRQTIDLGDFTLAIGDVVAAEVLHPEYSNLSVNEIVARQDPRGSADVLLPFEGFNYDLSRLLPAPAGPVSADRFEEVYARRAWGLFFISTASASRGHFHIGCWMMQVSHEPPRMAIAFRKTWEGSAWVQSGAPVAMTLLAQDQVPFVQAFAGGAQSAARLARDIEPLGDGLYTLKRGVAQFLCHPESTHDVGECTLIIARVADCGWIRNDAENLAAGEFAQRVQGPWRDPVEGFALGSAGANA